MVHFAPLFETFIERAQHLGRLGRQRPGAEPVAFGAAESLTAGQTRYYQYWYRDVADDGCVTNFNGSNAVSITWQP